MNESDLRIRQAALALADDILPPHASIEVDVQDGVVTLKGEAKLRDPKFRFEQAVAGLGGVLDVRDFMSVRGSWDHDSLSAREAQA